MNKFFLFIFLVNYATAELNLEEVVDLCDPSDSELDDCLLRAANKMVPFLAKGIEEFDIPVLDPLKMSKIDLGRMKRPLDFQLILYDAVQTGLSSTLFESARANFGEGVLELNGTLPHFRVEGRPLGNGKLFFFPVSGVEKAIFEFNNTKIFIRLLLESAPCRQTFYCLHVKKLDLSYTYDKFKIFFSHLSNNNNKNNNNNKRLDDAVNKFIASNKKKILDVVRTPLAQIYSRIFLSVLEKLFENIPIQRLFKTF